MECSSELFTEASGYLSSPEYPQPYPEDLQCNYSIRLQKGLSISLKFLEPFEIDDHQQVRCPYDQLKVLEISKLLPTLLPDLDRNSGYTHIWTRNMGSV